MKNIKNENNVMYNWGGGFFYNLQNDIYEQSRQAKCRSECGYFT